MFVGAIEDKLTRNSCMGDMYNSIPSVCSNRFSLPLQGPYSGSRTLYIALSSSRTLSEALRGYNLKAQSKAKEFTVNFR